MILTDIEGTTSSLSHLQTVLVPYARRRIPAWAQRPEAAAIVAETRRLTNLPTATLSQVTDQLLQWQDDDAKVVPLKTLQGMIWKHGFAKGEIFAHVYDDVPDALCRWADRKIPVYVYSSGSVAAQRAWFAHTQHGNLTRYFAGHFDIATAGHKTTAESYSRIAHMTETHPSSVTFITDSRKEIEAALTTGVHAVHIDRAATDDDPNRISDFNSL